MNPSSYSQVVHGQKREACLILHSSYYDWGFSFPLLASVYFGRGFSLFRHMYKTIPMQTTVQIRLNSLHTGAVQVASKHLGEFLVN